jgi:hypothetical protein
LAELKKQYDDAHRPVRPLSSTANATRGAITDSITTASATCRNTGCGANPIP